MSKSRARKQVDTTILRRALDRVKLLPSAGLLRPGLNPSGVGYSRDFARFASRSSRYTDLNRVWLQRRLTLPDPVQLITNQVMRRYLYPAPGYTFSPMVRIYRELQRQLNPQAVGTEPYSETHFDYDFAEPAPEMAWQEEAPVPPQEVRRVEAPQPVAPPRQVRLSQPDPVTPRLSDFSPPVLQSLTAPGEVPETALPSTAWNEPLMLHRAQPVPVENSPATAPKNSLMRAINRAEGAAALPLPGPQAAFQAVDVESMPVAEPPLAALARVLESQLPGGRQAADRPELPFSVPAQGLPSPETDLAQSAEFFRPDNFSPMPLIFRQPEKTPEAPEPEAHPGATPAASYESNLPSSVAPSPVSPTLAPEPALDRFAPGSLVARSYQGAVESQVTPQTPSGADSFAASPELFRPAIGNPAFTNWAAQLPLLQTNPGLASALPEVVTGFGTSQTQPAPTMRVFANRNVANGETEVEPVAGAVAPSAIRAESVSAVPPISRRVETEPGLVNSAPELISAPTRPLLSQFSPPVARLFEARNEPAQPASAVPGFNTPLMLFRANQGQPVQAEESGKPVSNLRPRSAEAPLSSPEVQPASSPAPVVSLNALQRSLERGEVSTTLLRTLAQAGLSNLPSPSPEALLQAMSPAESRTYTSPPLIWRKTGDYRPSQVEAAEPAIISRRPDVAEATDQNSTLTGLKLEAWISRLPALQSNPGLIPLAEREATPLTPIYTNLSPATEQSVAPKAPKVAPALQRQPVENDFPAALEAATEVKPVPRILATRPKTETPVTAEAETASGYESEQLEAAHPAEISRRAVETADEGAWAIEPISPMVSRFGEPATQPLGLTQMLHPNTWVQRKAKDSAAPVPASPIGLPNLDTVLRTTAGRPLTPAIQTQMGQIFRTSLEHVRVHHDEPAANYTQAMGAEAFTVGNHIFFGPGRYEPETPAGQALLGHELTHVVQQASLPSLGQGRIPEVSPEGQMLERQAIENERAIFHHLSNSSPKAESASGNGASSVQRSYTPAEALNLPLENMVNSNGNGASLQRVIEGGASSDGASAHESGGGKKEEHDIEKIAEQVFRMLKSQLKTDRERHGARGGLLM